MSCCAEYVRLMLANILNRRNDYKILRFSTYVSSETRSKVKLSLGVQLINFYNLIIGDNLSTNKNKLLVVQCHNGH